MTNGEKFVLSWIGAMILGIAIVIATYNHNRNIIMADMVKNGANPIAVACAMDDTSGNNPSCILLLTQE